MWTFRQASLNDVTHLAETHVAAWREAYLGLLPRAMLDGLSVEGRAAMWRRVLEDAPQGARSSVILCEDAGRIAGFGACGPQRDETLRQRGYTGEISALYVLRSHQRMGIGRSIMITLAQHLWRRGHTGMSLWVLRDNQTAQKFYESLGAVSVAEKSDVRAEATLEEVAYAWHDIRTLAGWESLGDPRAGI